MTTTASGEAIAVHELPWVAAKVVVVSCVHFDRLLEDFDVTFPIFGKELFFQLSCLQFYTIILPSMVKYRGSKMRTRDDGRLFRLVVSIR
jgi:hypothetical protein